MKIITVAVVGLGYWGPNLVRNFVKIPGVSIKYLCDIQQENLDAIAKDYPLIRKTTNFTDLLQDETLDLIAIATPLSTHFSLAEKALISGKHVFIEKPMTQTSTQASALIKLAKKKNKVLMVGHTFIYSSAVWKMKEYIDEKKLGKLYYYDSTRINLGGFQSDTNVLWDLASHDLAILSYIMPVQAYSIYATANQYIQKNRVEVAHLFLRLTHNISAHIHVSWLSPVKIRTILIGGSQKMILYNDIEPSEKIKIYTNDVVPLSHVTPFSPAYRSGDVVIPQLSQEETMYIQLSHTISCIRQNKRPLSDGEQGLKVIQLLEAAEKSLQTKKEVFINE